MSDAPIHIGWLLWPLFVLWMAGWILLAMQGPSWPTPEECDDE